MNEDMNSKKNTMRVNVTFIYFLFSDLFNVGFT